MLALSVARIEVDFASVDRELRQLPDATSVRVREAVSELAWKASVGRGGGLSEEATCRLHLDCEGYRVVCELEGERLVVRSIRRSVPRKHARLLLVDDDRFVLTVVGDQLWDAGHEVVSVTSGEAALAQDLESFDAVVCDYLMPGMDGGELLRRIRDERHSEVTFVFITSTRKPEDLVRLAIRYGADFLPKPVRVDQVLEVIEERRAEKARRSGLLQSA